MRLCCLRAGVAGRHQAARDTHSGIQAVRGRSSVRRQPSQRALGPHQGKCHGLGCDSPCICSQHSAFACTLPAALGPLACSTLVFDSCTRHSIQETAHLYPPGITDEPSAICRSVSPTSGPTSTSTSTASSPLRCARCWRPPGRLPPSHLKRCVLACPLPLTQRP